MQHPCIVVCGPSGSGKSTVGEAIRQALDAENTGETHTERAVVVSQDDYFTKQFVPYAERFDDSFEG